MTSLSLTGYGSINLYSDFVGNWSGKCDSGLTGKLELEVDVVPGIGELLFTFNDSEYYLNHLVTQSNSGPPSSWTYTKVLKTSADKKTLVLYSNDTINSPETNSILTWQDTSTYEVIDHKLVITTVRKSHDMVDSSQRDYEDREVCTYTK